MLGESEFERQVRLGRESAIEARERQAEIDRRAEERWRDVKASNPVRVREVERGGGGGGAFESSMQQNLGLLGVGITRGVKYYTIGMAASRRLRHGTGVGILILLLVGAGLVVVGGGLAGVGGQNAGGGVAVTGIFLFFIGVIGAIMWVIASVMARVGRTVAEDVSETYDEIRGVESHVDDPTSESQEEDGNSQFLHAREWYVKGELSESAFRTEIEAAFPGRSKQHIDYLMEVARGERDKTRSGDPWLLQKHGVQLGPVAFETLRAWAAEGTLKPDDLVCIAGSREWVAAKAIGDLFPTQS
jgi:hypothetical protein